VLGLFAKKAAFLVTPKTSEQAKWWEALRANWAESSLALLGMLGIAGALTRPTELAGPLLAGLLLFPTLGMAAAPFNSWAAQRAALPPDLQQVRTMEWKRSQRRQTLTRVGAVGGLVTVLGVIVAAVALFLTPGRQPVQTPNLVAPAHAASTPSPSPATHASPSPSSTSPSPTPAATTPSPTATPTPTPSPTVSPTPTPTSS
jgi:cell division septation protein DedD